MSFKKGWLPRLSALFTLALAMVLVTMLSIMTQTGAHAAQSSGGFPTISPSQLRQSYLSPSQMHTAAQMTNVKRAAGFSGGGIQFVPTFNGSFSFNGQTFPFTMVGSDPSLGSHRSEEHTSELQSRRDLVCRLLLEKKN